MRNHKGFVKFSPIKVFNEKGGTLPTVFSFQLEGALTEKRLGTTVVEKTDLESLPTKTTISYI